MEVIIASGLAVIIIILRQLNGDDDGDDNKMRWYDDAGGKDQGKGDKDESIPSDGKSGKDLIILLIKQNEPSKKAIILKILMGHFQLVLHKSSLSDTGVSSF